MHRRRQKGQPGWLGFGRKLFWSWWLWIAVAAVGGYFASLDALSRVAEQKKEVLIEALCR